MRKCIFLDRDGVINKERGDYTYKIEDFMVEEDVILWLKKLKKKGYLLIIITNQGGINKGLYNKEDVFKCHQHFQNQSENVIDDLFYCPYHDDYTLSLSRKPNPLMLERAIYKWSIDIENSWMVGDSKRDVICAQKIGCKSIYVGNKMQKEAELSVYSPAQALQYIAEL